MKDRILVVDDDPSIRAILAGLLRKSYTIDTAATGEIALELAAREAPAVVLLDIMLPGIDGYETCRRLKSSLFDGKVQVIMISAASSQEEQFRAFEAGADAYMVKPVDANVLRSEVQLHLRLREAIGRLASIEAEIQSRRAELQRLVEDRERQIGATQDVAVFAIARVAESRDEETGEHVIRVRSYSRVLAEELAKSDRYRRQIDEQFLRDLYRSSPLHDIGKVAISDTILLKAGRLTAKEFELVKIHTIHGADILDAVVSHSQSGDFLAMAAAIAKHHHEWFNGTGYPERLEGEEIPLAARIVAVADVFDALTSRRPYKLAFPPADARRIIHAESGSHFDPAVVKAFEACFIRFLEIHARHADRDSIAAAPVPGNDLPFAHPCAMAQLVP
jgi:putative two-component system response regulator